MAKATSIASSDHNERLEPQVLRAAENDNVERLREILEQARDKGQLTDNFLRIALMRSAEKGKVNATTFLLDQNAPTGGAQGNRLSPLLRTIERDNPNQLAIVKALLEHGADPETRDKKGRTALMTAAWKNHYHIVDLLLKSGADVNGKDNRGRHVLHNLGADKDPKWGSDVLGLLLNQNIHIDGPEAQDELGRTPLHWACATGKLNLMSTLLDRRPLPADIHAVEGRGKTPLHLAASHELEDVVLKLLEYGADVNKKSDGGWTALHNAAEKGFLRIVKILVESKALVNEKLLNGASPLHHAAQGGHIEVVKYLLGCEGIKKASRDTFGITPFLRAAQYHHKDVVELLAPSNNAATLSKDALGACQGFTSTVVDFGNYHNGNRVKRHSVYDLLYGRDRENPRKPAMTILPSEEKGKQATQFRWIHIPANNIAWIETLLTKWFIEDDLRDFEGFKALEKSFSHQHRGKQSHSHFMRPLCQSTPRAPRHHEPQSTLSQDATPSTPTIIISGASIHSDDSSLGPMKRNFSGSDGKDWTKNAKERGRDQGKEGKTAGKENVKAGKGNKPSKPETPDKHHRKPSGHHDHRHPRPPASPTRKDHMVSATNNVFAFMPYLHFETTESRKAMQSAIKEAELLNTPLYPYHPSKATTADEMMIRAHLAGSSSVSLHVRRTLDQSFYHNINTESRDVDQVVYRYQLNTASKEEPVCDPKIFMVDQLWIWILGKDLILTSFPQRWNQPKNDPLSVLDSIIEDINSKVRDPVKSVYDLATIITARCSGTFDRHLGDEAYQFLDMFESSIGNVTDKETELFKEFNHASAQASAWLKHHQRSKRLSWLVDENNDGTDDSFLFEDSKITPLFVDKLLDIGQETNLLGEARDIRDELIMIRKVLEDQQQVLPSFEAAICDIYADERRSQQDVKKRYRDQLKVVENHINDIDRMDKQAERIYKSITVMLDLKQKHANAFEARFARDQAAGTNRQSHTVMVFTIVTIIFLPLSFIAAFFTINIEEFPGQGGSGGGGGGGSGLPLAYVSKYLFGLGFAISIPLILVALNLDYLSDTFTAIKRRMANRKKMKEERRAREAETQVHELDHLRIHRTFSDTRSKRTMEEEEWANREFSRSRSPRLSRETAGTAGRREREKVTGFRLRVSADIERGLG